ncbi:MAG: NAD synthetase [Candidatus Puniceispirillum sp.]|nr:NAD synthetase [Candidatus Pelagibacter sp.]MBA4283589.1 NAD synthetase [Candidatus Puniceispirillum sp.]
MKSILGLLDIISILSIILTIDSFKSVKTAPRGIFFAALAMVCAILGSSFDLNQGYFYLALLTITGGAVVGRIVAGRVTMTQLPELVAGFHSLVGLSAVTVAWGIYTSSFKDGVTGLDCIHLLELWMGIVIGAITFSGSVIAFIKLSGREKYLFIKGISNTFNLFIMFVVIFFGFIFIQSGSCLVLLISTIIALFLGCFMILNVGGADMPVIVSMLNSYSGWAAAGVGFSLGNQLLIAAGSIVGASGAILSYIMCKGMNRSLMSVLFKPIQHVASQSQGIVDKPHKVATPQDAAYMLSEAQNVVIVPGYGMAVAQAQHVVNEMVVLLKEKGVNVRFAIHPVAGRMPGHMNVLLAEASIPYTDVFEMEEINSDFHSVDVAFVIGANDVTNPAAETDKTSPLFGMPVLQVGKARTVLFSKRSMASGYAGVENPLFYDDKTFMLLGDAKKMCEHIIRDLKNDAA